MGCTVPSRKVTKTLYIEKRVYVETSEDTDRTELVTILTLNLPTTTIVAQPFNIIKWQVKFNPVA